MSSWLWNRSVATPDNKRQFAFLRVDSHNRGSERLSGIPVWRSFSVGYSRVAPLCETRMAKGAVGRVVEAMDQETGEFFAVKFYNTRGSQVESLDHDGP